MYILATLFHRVSTRIKLDHFEHMNQVEWRNRHTLLAHFLINHGE